MLRNVFLKAIQEQRRSLFWWVVGMSTLNVGTLLFYPVIKDATGINELMQEFGPLMEPFMGGIEDITSPEGYIHSQLFSFMIPLLFIALGITVGSGAIAGEEERGTLDLLLSNPLDRWRVVVEKFGANLVAMALLAIGTWGGLVVGVLMVKMDISYVRLAEATIGSALLGGTFGALAFALGSAWGKRGAAAGITSAVAVAASMLDTLAQFVDWLEPLRFASPFYYYNSGSPLVNGLDPLHVLVLAGLTAALLAVAVVTFERRDLGIG